MFLQRIPDRDFLFYFS